MLDQRLREGRTSCLYPQQEAYGLQPFNCTALVWCALSPDWLFTEDTECGGQGHVVGRYTTRHSTSVTRMAEMFCLRRCRRATHQLWDSTADRLSERCSAEAVSKGSMRKHLSIYAVVFSCCADGTTGTWHTIRGTSCDNTWGIRSMPTILFPIWPCSQHVHEYMLCIHSYTASGGASCLLYTGLFFRRIVRFHSRVLKRQIATTLQLSTSPFMLNHASLRQGSTTHNVDKKIVVVSDRTSWITLRQWVHNFSSFCWAVFTEHRGWVKPVRAFVVLPGFPADSRGGGRPQYVCSGSSP